MAIGPKRSIEGTIESRSAVRRRRSAAKKLVRYGKDGSRRGEANRIAVAAAAATAAVRRK